MLLILWKNFLLAFLDWIGWYIVKLMWQGWIVWTFHIFIGPLCPVSIDSSSILETRGISADSSSSSTHLPFTSYPIYPPSKLSISKHYQFSHWLNFLFSLQKRYNINILNNISFRFLDVNSLENIKSL